MSRRHGLSLVEVLLALGIIAIVVVILLPVVVRQRGPSGRSKNWNNLKQIALAVHNYNDAYQGKLPPLVDVGEGAPIGAGLQSLFFNILPYIEQDNVYRLFNKAVPSTYYLRSDGAAQTLVRTYISPADETAPNGQVAAAAVALPAAPPAPFAQSFTGYYATTSYAANGMIPWNTGGQPKSFEDGTANTILFAERPQACTDPSGATVYNLWGFGMYGPPTPAFALLTPDDPAGLPPTGQVAPAVPLGREYVPGPVAVRVGRESAPPQPSPAGRPFQVGLKWNSPCDPRVPGSPHPGGMLVALADGSVRTVNPNISEWTFWAAVTPDGKETLYSDW